MLGSAPLGAAPLGAAGGGFSATYTLSLDAGFFRIVGDGEAFSNGYTLSLDPGHIALTGPDANIFKATYSLVRGAGAFALGGDVVFLRNHRMVLDPGEISILVSATAAVFRGMPLGIGAFHLGFAAVTYLKGFSVHLDPITFRLAGQLGMAVSRALSLDAGAVKLTGRTTKLQARRLLSVDPGHFAVTPGVAGFATGYTMKLDPGVFRTARPAAGLVTHRALGLEARAITVAAPDLRTSVAHKLQLRSGTISLGGSAGLAAARAAGLSPRAVAVTGHDATMRAQRRLQLGPGRFTRTGQALTLRRAAGMTLEPGVFHLQGTLRTVAHHGLPLDPGHLAVTGVSATFGQQSRYVTLDTGVFSLHAGSLLLDYSGSLDGLCEGPRWHMASDIYEDGQELPL